MEREVLMRSEGNGETKHIVFRCGPEIRTRNGVIIVVGKETLVLRTIRHGEICVRLNDLLRIEDFREKARDDSWREVYRSYGCSTDYEEGRGGGKNG